MPIESHQFAIEINRLQNVSAWLRLWTDWI